MYDPRYVGGVVECDTRKCTTSEAIAKNDFVTLLTDGQIEATGAGEGIYGIALEAATAASEEILVLLARPGMIVYMDNDNVGTTFASTHVGGRFDITGTTGAQLVDTNTVAQDGADSGQLFCIGYNPKGYGFDSDTSIGLYEVAEIQGLTAAIS